MPLTVRGISTYQLQPRSSFEHVPSLAGQANSTRLAAMPDILAKQAPPEPGPDRPLGTEARARRRTHFMRAALVGLCAGLLAVAFRRTLALAEAGRERLLHILHGHPSWGWAVMPIVGLSAGGLVGWMTVRFAPEAEGSGIPHLKGVLLHVHT